MLKPKNSDSETNVRNLLNVGLIVLFVILLTLFCKAMQYSLILPLLLFFVGMHLHLAGKGGLVRFLQYGLLLTIIMCATEFIHQYTDIPHYYIPVAGIIILTTLLFNDLEVSFLMSFVASIIVALILGEGFGMMLTFFVGGIVGAYLCKEARTRGQLFSAAFFIGLIHVICMILLNIDSPLLNDMTFITKQILPGALNGFVSTFIVMATLKIFEYLFGVVTNFSLLELADFNQPLLKRMILEAPGTYHHSLVVSNLAESAADAIGAHALLTRVGAYYHDIGKMLKPQYFTENQLLGGNLHDKIEPSMSRLVILNHVKEGIELAQKNKLNQAIIDFIPEHHGTSVIYYFYQKSLEASDNPDTLNEDNFRYPGPKPRSRETAITLLADSVEGATRALDDPNPKNIDDTVRKIVNNKFIDGQLDDCPLTLKEIDKISETFIRILTAMYHGRIKYPEKTDKKDANSNRKSSKQSNPQQTPDSDNSPKNPSV